MKAIIKRGGELVLRPESEIEAYAVGLWRTRLECELGPDMPRIEVDHQYLPTAPVAPVRPTKPR